MDVVPGYGNPHAKILCLGEAPAKEEMRQGRPFVGRAGQEVDRLFAQAGIKRSEVYITNASLRAVQGDKEKWFFNSDGSPSAIFLEGLHALMADIQRIRPNVVVAFGNYALWALMQHQEIMKWRGSILWSSVFNVKVVPTLHPAALLRGGGDDFAGLYQYRPVVIWDLERASEQSLYPETRYRPRQLLVNPTGAERSLALERLYNAPRLTVDIETHGGLRLACIGFGDGDPEWACTFPYDGQRQTLELYRSLLETPTPKVGQNLMFDVTALDQLGVHTRNIAFDTMLAQHTILPDLPKGLDFLTSIYTDMPYYKDEGKAWRDEGRKEEFFRYNAKDICATTEVSHEQAIILSEDEGLTRTFKRRMLIFEPLRWSTYYGAPIDREELKRRIKQLNAKREVLQRELDTDAGWEVNVMSSPQVKRLLYEEKGHEPRRRKKKVTANAEVLMDIAAKTGEKSAVLIIAVRQVRKLLSTYYKEDIISPDGRVRCEWKIAGTKTGRLSSAEPLWGVGINQQNQPAEVRELYPAEPGWEYGEFDQMQAEAVVTAYYAEDPLFMDCFRTGKDVHRVMAALMSGLRVEDWESIGKKDPRRQQGKKCNHAFDYDMGPVTFMYTINKEWDPEDPTSLRVTQDQATELRNQYMALRPALNNYWAYVRTCLSKDRTLINPLGWKRTLLGAWSDTLFKDGYSWIPQSTVGESTNIGIIKTLAHPEIQRAKVRLVWQTHDAATYTWPIEARDTVVPIILQRSEVPLYINGHFVVVPIEGAVGPTWGKNSLKGIGESRKVCEVTSEEFQRLREETDSVLNSVSPGQLVTNCWPNGQ